MRLIILSNRLQVTIFEKDGSLDVQPSAGGLVSGMAAYLASIDSSAYIWIGWPGSSNFGDPEKLKNELYANYHSWPVFVEEHIMDLFYNGFCNKTIWPLFHYFPSMAVYDEKTWENYKQVNGIFADAVSDIMQPDDILWIHDYHLMLVPELIRRKKPAAAIGFFLHIPFPSYEIFRLLPRRWGQELLNGLLDADLIGFHTYDYTQYFLRCVLRILGYNHNMGMIALRNKTTKAATFPMGIDFDRYHDAVNLATVKKEKRQLRKELRNLKVIFSVDRQDYSKGILNRLEGYELFLKNNPQWHQKVVLIMIIVPSRIDVEEYQAAKNTINQLIGKINGDYGNLHWTPVIYQYKSISFEHLVALYNTSEIGLVTPLRDGMNLVSKEYVAAQREKRGVLILSEMAGAAMELGEALIINPNNRDEIAEAIKTALEMPFEEQARRISSMQERLKKYDVKSWAAGFLETLALVKKEGEGRNPVHLDESGQSLLLNRFRNASKKIIFLDYDGTLVPFAKKPADAFPGRKLIRIVKAFSGSPKVEVVIISGRIKDELENWYGRMNITLAAEHGVWIKKPKEEWRLTRSLNNDWKPEIISILKKYRDRLRHSFIEEKEYSIVWHFRNSDQTMSELRVREFVDDIVQFTAQNEIEVLPGKKVVEIKCSGVNKGTAAGQILAGRTHDFIMAAGDDDTDEFLFRALPSEAFTVKIGKQNSHARYYLKSHHDLLYLLEKIANVKKNTFSSILDFFRI